MTARTRVHANFADNLKKAVLRDVLCSGNACCCGAELCSTNVADGHEVENHTYSHPNLDQAILSIFVKSIYATRSLSDLLPADGRNSLDLQAATRTASMELAHECGMLEGSDVDAITAEDSGSSAQVASYVVSHAKNGAIILMHNGSVAKTLLSRRWCRA